MFTINLESLEKYLQESLGNSVKLKATGEIGLLQEQGIKEFGYGKALEITYEKDGQEYQAVLSVMKGDRYGHQFYWDRAAILMFEYYAGSRLEKHVTPIGLGYIDEKGQLIPVKQPKEFFILNEKVTGDHYFLDLERIKQSGLEANDLKMARKMARWLARVHSHKFDDPDIYLRRVRQLVGDSECIWGIIDGYPFPYEHFSPGRFQQLEKNLVGWRWKLREYTHRLAVTHGDFHPWNVLVKRNDFWVLDRSRGEWGEPADDVAAMTCNYVMYSLYRDSSFASDFQKLYLTFWEEYLEQTSDLEMLEIIAPFYVFRALVVAHPEWYPNHPPEVRQSLIRFIENVIAEDHFEYQNVNKYTDITLSVR